MHACTHTHTHTHTHKHSLTHTHIHTRTHACIHTCMHTHAHSCIHKHTHTHTHTHTTNLLHCHQTATSLTWGSHPFTVSLAHEQGVLQLSQKPLQGIGYFVDIVVIQSHGMGICNEKHNQRDWETSSPHTAATGKSPTHSQSHTQKF